MRRQVCACVICNTQKVFSRRGPYSICVRTLLYVHAQLSSSGDIGNHILVFFPSSSFILCSLSSNKAIARLPSLTEPSLLAHNIISTKRSFAGSKVIYIVLVYSFVFVCLFMESLFLLHILNNFYQSLNGPSEFCLRASMIRNKISCNGSNVV